MPWIDEQASLGVRTASLLLGSMSNTLSDADQKELSAFLDTEQSKARMQTTVHAFTERCWDQCMTGSIGARFGRGEEACLSNCVERYVHSSIRVLTSRFLDTSLFIVCGVI